MDVNLEGIIYSRRVPRLALWSLLLFPPRYAFPQGASFPEARTTKIELQGLEVRVGSPIEVTAQVSWATSWLDENGLPKTGYVHFFPTIARFPQGEIIASYDMDADSRAGPALLSGFQISRDGGRHWQRRYGVLPEHNLMIFIPKGNDSLLALPSDLTEMSPGDDRNFTGPTFLFEHGGDSMLMIPNRMRIVDWPWPVAVIASAQPRESWIADITVIGSVVTLGDGLFATAIAKRKGARFAESVLLRSQDGGYTWRYFSTMARADPALAGQEGYAGPDETAVVKLTQGDMMALVRVGYRNQPWRLRQTYSHDGGRTWHEAAPSPAFTVRPVLLRTANGTLALSTGRPGIDLWLSTDPLAQTWQRIDIVALHNAWATDPTYRISSSVWGPRKSTVWQTSAYTGMVETSPNRLLLIYDRDAVIRPPERAPLSPQDISRVFVLPIEIDRN